MSRLTRDQVCQRYLPVFEALHRLVSTTEPATVDAVNNALLSAFMRARPSKERVPMTTKITRELKGHSGTRYCPVCSGPKALTAKALPSETNRRHAHAA